MDGAFQDAIFISDDYLNQDQEFYGSPLKNSKLLQDHESQLKLPPFYSHTQLDTNNKTPSVQQAEQGTELDLLSNMDAGVVQQQSKIQSPELSKQLSDLTLKQEDRSSEVNGKHKQEKEKDLWETVNDVQSGERDQDIMEAQRQVPNVKRTFEERTLKIIVLGRSGIGRTTFIKNLFLSYTQDKNFAPLDASSIKWEQFEERASECLTEVQVNDDTNLIRYKFNIQDTPGLNNDDQSKVGQVTNFILNESYKQYMRDIKMDKDEPNTNLAAFDLCLYMLPPHQITQFDIESVRFLSSVVNTLPILAKADSLNPEELQQQKKMVYNSLYATPNNISNDSTTLFQFSDDTLERAQVKQEPSQPLAIVASNQLHSEIPFWPIRKYRWGQCCAFRERDSDLKFLRRLIFEQGYWQIKESSQKLYQDFCKDIHKNIVPVIMKMSQSNLQDRLQDLSSNKTSNLNLQNDDASINSYDSIQNGAKEQDQQQSEGSVSNPDEVSSMWSSEAAPEDTFDYEQYDFFDKDGFVEATVSDCVKRDNKYSVTLSLHTIPSKILKIQVGQVEGLNICNTLNSTKVSTQARPSIYDVAAKMAQEQALKGVCTVSRITVDSLQSSVFYCSVWQSYGSNFREKCYDARPSDGINLALRLECPIFVSKHLAQIQGF